MEIDTTPIGHDRWIRENNLREKGPGLPYLDGRIKCDFNKCDEWATQHFLSMCCDTVNLMCDRHVMVVVHGLDHDMFLGCDGCGMEMMAGRKSISRPKPLALDA